MLSNGDLGSIANLIGNQEEAYIGVVEDVDVGHLDYHYIDKCKDRTEIVKLLNHLKSGKEGFYPDLELHMLKRLNILDPENHPMPLSEKERHEERNKVAKELEDWESSIPASTTTNFISSSQRKPNSAPVVVASTTSVALATTSVKPPQPKNSGSRIKSHDYRSWDIFDVDKELEKIDDNSPTTAPNNSYSRTIINKKEKTVVVPSDLDIKQRKTFAENEKVKGNDCMRSLDYDEALDYYSTSLALCPSAAVYNNRALAYLKLERYDKCIDDTTSSLNMETSFKALLRRSTAYYSVGKYQLAVMDVDQALELDAASKEATSLRAKILDKWADVDGTVGGGAASIRGSAPLTETSSNRIAIQEIEDDDDEEEETETIITPGAVLQNQYEHASVKKQSKVVIVDVEDDSSDDEM